MTAIGTEPLLMSALLLGAVGSVHCLAMCGGIAGALGQAAAPQAGLRSTLRIALYSLGRMTSYAVAGTVVGFLGETFAAWTGFSVGLRVMAGLLILLFGLHVSGWWNGLAAIERLGMVGWKRLSPLAKRIGRPDRSWKVFALGLLWGWLPCGLVYSALIAAAASGSAPLGAAFMACFGLGTLPAMWAASGFGARLGAFLASGRSRRAAGILLLTFGALSIFGAMMPLMHSGTHSGGSDAHAPPGLHDSSMHHSH